MVGIVLGESVEVGLALGTYLWVGGIVSVGNWDGENEGNKLDDVWLVVLVASVMYGWLVVLFTPVLLFNIDGWFVTLDVGGSEAEADGSDDDAVEDAIVGVKIGVSVNTGDAIIEGW